MTATTRKWDGEVPTVLLGYRASVQASTRYTPFHILRGQDMQLPIQQTPSIPVPAVGCENPTAQALVDGLLPLQKVLTQAHSNILAAQQKLKQMTHYAARHLHGATPATSATLEAAAVATAPTVEDKGKAIVSVPGAGGDHAEAGPSNTDTTPAAKQKSTPLTGKRPNQELQVNDFVVIRMHKLVRTAGEKRG